MSVKAFLRFWSAACCCRSVRTSERSPKLVSWRNARNEIETLRFFFSRVCSKTHLKLISWDQKKFTFFDQVPLAAPSMIAKWDAELFYVIFWKRERIHAGKFTTNFIVFLSIVVEFSLYILTSIPMPKQIRLKNANRRSTSLKALRLPGKDSKYVGTLSNLFAKYWLSWSVHYT